MAAKKRSNDTSNDDRKSKKPKTEKPTTKAAPPAASTLISEEVDFPRGGGTSLSALEVKTLRAEAVKEADEALFEENAAAKKSKKRKSTTKGASASGHTEKGDRIRIEHLNYKRINIGMKILGQIVSIQPLALIVSLPNQLFAHVPITHISSQLTSLLEGHTESDEEPEDDEDEENGSPSSRVPDLADIFTVGEYVRAVVTAVHASGVGDVSVIGKSRDDVVRTSRRVELTLVPERVNQGVQKGDLKPGFTITASVQSIEDHGYVLDLGVPDVPGFLSFKDVKKHHPNDTTRFHIGRLLNVSVSEDAAKGRTCKVTLDPRIYTTTLLTEVSNVTSVLPGTLVQALVTAVHPSGLNLQLLGFFDGTAEQLHLEPNHTYKIGKRLKARVLYDYSTTPPRFALSLNPRVVSLKPRQIKREEGSELSTVQDAYPVGTILESVKVTRVENERGLFVEIQPGLEGFVHISHVSDDHVTSLPPSSGPFKVGSIHPARVTGYFAFDGVLQLSLKPSIIAQRFFHVAEVEVGEVIKGTIKKLTDNGLFVSLSGKFDGVVWPNHYADITLKHPAKRFKPGASIKCRILHVDPERNRISLTAKKTLVDSTLPIISKPEDAQAGIVVHAVVFKVSEKQLLVEFYNNLKAVIPLREVSESKLPSLADAYPIGKVVKVRILSTDLETSRIVASIRQAASTSEFTMVNIDAVEIGDTVEGIISDIHKDNAVLILQPTKVKALLSLKNLANHRGVSVAEVQTAAKRGEKLEELVVVTRSPEKGLVIVANKPKSKVTLGKSKVSLDTVTIGQIVTGRVTRHTRNGALFKFGSHLGGILHPTDTCDDYDASVPIPDVNSVVKAAVVEIATDKKQVALSTRASRLDPDGHPLIKDREVINASDLKHGDSVRGFVKSITPHGLFVSIGRHVDARVQIKELFDEFVKDWQPRFKLNQVVKGRILSVNAEDKRVEMTFRSGDLSKARSALTLADFNVGQKVEGTVKKVEDYGLFIQIQDSKLSGLCHKTQLSDNKDADVTVALRGFREGDRVKALVLDTSKGRISLGIKPSYFADDEVINSDNDEPDAVEPNETFDGADEQGDSDAMALDAKEADDHSSDAEDDDEAPSDDDDDNMQIDSHDLVQPSTSQQQPSPSTLPVPTLQLQGGFQWSAGDFDANDGSDDDSSSDEDQAEDQTKKRKRQKKQIEHDLTADMHTKTPESNADFERVLLGSPNSSFLWIQYMSFQLQLSETDKAREIAKRALATINFREEQEKLNVWIALLNLENVYGTDTSLEATFKDAARHNDSKTIHLRLAAILDQSDKVQRAEEQYKRTSKKFGHSSKVWTLFGEFYLRRGEVESARNLLPRSLQSLEKRKHIKTISRFAQLEYKLGDAERGKTIFEGIVDSHPKRWDMWSIYIDMEAGQQDMQSVRNIFERVLAIKMTSHKAKSFFKKWLELERRIGDEEGADHVKAKAITWTQQAAGP
ncbi:rRNA biogenesis protein rrp5 [Pleurotus ostreatus]|nr:rRNA biogenesis protein rrp5 [Pleurotus ostreatus]